MAEVFRLIVPGKPEYVQIVKMTVGTAAAAEGFCYDDIEDIKMAVAEAVKIVTCHNFGGWSDSCEILCEREGKELKLVVTDKEGTHSIEKNTQRCLDCPREGDLSLQVIKSLVDRVDVDKFQNGFKSISMIKRIGQ